MRLARFDSEGVAHAGIVDGEEMIDLAPTGSSDDTVELIASWDPASIASAAEAAPRIPLDQIRLLAPVLPRKNVIAVGRNYRDHAAEFSASGFDASEKQVIPDHPVVFSKATSSIVGPDDPIVLANDPTGTTDYEGEMAVVIGSPGRNVSPDRALDHVFGWTIVNDVTARDLQKRHVQWFIGKSPDSFCPMGPWVVTIDEVPDIESSWMRTRVNGEIRQEAPIEALIFGVRELIATLSEVMTLEAGDVIATGTGRGVGIGFDPPKYLQAGDVVEVTIDRVGTLRNPVV